MTHNHIQQLDPSPDQQHPQHCKRPCDQHVAIPLPSADLPQAVPRHKNVALASLSPWCQPSAPRLTPRQHPPSAPSSVVPLSFLSGAGKHRATCSASGCRPDQSAGPLQQDHCSQHTAVTLQLLHVLCKALGTVTFLWPIANCDATYDNVFKHELVYD